MRTSINNEGLILPKLDLSNIEQGPEDDGRLFRHNGNSEINIEDGKTTTEPGIYSWNQEAGVWHPSGRYSTFVGGYTESELAKQTNFNDLESSHNTLRNDHDTLRSDHDTLRNEHNTLDSDVDDLRTDFDNHDADTENPHSVTYSQVDAPSTSAFNTLESKHNTLRNEFDTLEEEHDSLDTDVSDLTTEVNNHKSNYQNPHNVGYDQVGAPSQGSFDNLETSHNTLRSDHDTLRNDHDSLDSDVSTLRNDHDNLRSDHDSLDSNHDTLRSDFDSHDSNTSNPHNVTYSQVDAVPQSDVGSSNGVAELNSDRLVPSSQLPAIAISETNTVADESERLALSAEKGDIAIQQDVSNTYILKGDDPSVSDNWEELKTPESPVQSVFGRTGDISASSGDYDVSQIDNSASNSQVNTVQSNLDDHESDSDNPHSVTTGQIGAATASNLSDHENDTENPHNVDNNQVDAPSTSEFNNHTSDTSNPHSVTTSQIDAAHIQDLANHEDDSGNPHNVTASQAGALPASGGTATGSVTFENASGSSGGVKIGSDSDNHLSIHGNRVTLYSGEDNGWGWRSGTNQGGYNWVMNLDHNGNLRPEGSIYENGSNRVATRTWTNSNFNNYSDGDARSAVDGSSVSISGEAGSTQTDIDNHKNDTNNPHNISADDLGGIYSDQVGEIHVGSTEPSNANEYDIWIRTQ